MKASADTSIKALDDDKATTSTAGDWKVKMQERRAIDKENAADAIDHSYDLGEARIESMPEETRFAASEVFTMLSDIAIQAWANIEQAFIKLFDQIANFLQKIWEGLEAAGEAVGHAAESAYHAIASIF